MDYSPPGSLVHGILQARILEWVAMFSSRIFLTQCLMSPTLAGRFFTTSATWEVQALEANGSSWSLWITLCMQRCTASRGWLGQRAGKPQNQGTDYSLWQACLCESRDPGSWGKVVERNERVLFWGNRGCGKVSLVPRVASKSSGPWSSFQVIISWQSSTGMGLVNFKAQTIFLWMQVLILHGTKFLYLLQFLFFKQYCFRVQNLIEFLTYYAFFFIILLMWAIKI